MGDLSYEKEAGTHPFMLRIKQLLMRSSNVCTDFSRAEKAGNSVAVPMKAPNVFFLPSSR